MKPHPPTQDVHVGEQVDRISVVFQDRFADDPKSVQLVAQSTLADDELGRVRSIETVDAVCPRNSPLQRRFHIPVVSVAEEAGDRQDVLGNRFKRSDHILVAAASP